MHTVHIVCKSTYFLTTRQTFRLKITRISKIYPPKQKNPRKICTYQKFSVTLHPLLKHEASANNQKIHRGVEQLVARQAHNLEVTRSSRVSATIITEIPYMQGISVFVIKRGDGSRTRTDETAFCFTVLSNQKKKIERTKKNAQTKL